MKRTHVIVLFAAGAFAASTPQASAQTAVRFGYCTAALSSAFTPFAIAAKIWWAAAGIKVELVPTPGSTNCVKAVASRDVSYSLPSIEPLAIMRHQGVKAKNFYTAYQGNIYGVAVPEDSPIKSFAELKGKRIGVTSMASGGVIIARALAATLGWNPDRDISIVVVGDAAAQIAVMVREGQIEALSLFDVQYALVENTGIKVRLLDKDNAAIAHFPSNGFIALEETLATKRAEAVALAQGYAKGTIFAMANPFAAVRILWEVFPTTKATSKTEKEALLADVKTLMARASNWRLEPAGVTRWGENSEANYAAYIAFLVKNGVLKEKVDVGDLVTNELIDEINKFDAAAIDTMAKNYK